MDIIKKIETNKKNKNNEINKILNININYTITFEDDKLILLDDNAKKILVSDFIFFGIYQNDKKYWVWSNSIPGISKKQIKTIKNSMKMNKTKIVFVYNNWNIANLPVSQHEMFSIYSDSVFVINGRGNVVLDCFRIYEALVCGAIPVIVGNMNEINIAFNYDNNIPPFVYADTWDDAVIICNNLLKEPEKLQKKQDEMLIWWKNVLSNIKNDINNVLSSSC
jgi:hypothetical protein